MEAVAEACARAGKSLILMPEIALTGAVPGAFRDGASACGPRNGIRASRGRKRERIFSRRRSGRGAWSSRARAPRSSCRSATSGLIIVDEEHESAYKQEDGVTYHARDMAVVRGHIEGAPVVLASATPSIETRVNAARAATGT